MLSANPAAIRPADVLRAAAAHPWRLALPVIIFTVLGLAYALLRPATWEATQALIVRDEAVGNTVRPGRFTHLDDMKTAQETVLELIKSRTVLAGALAAVGPPADYRSAEAWPSADAIEALEQTIRLTPPKGAEFGKTEVFYLKVSAPERKRAIELASAVCHELETQFERLRVSKYQGVIDELTKTVSLAEADLNKSTAELTAVEKHTGRDLAELRTLNESPSSDSALRRMSNEIETELRTYRAQVASGEEMLHLLESAQDDPGRLLASPNRLFEAQPALRRLKDGLVDAQLRTAQLLGTMSEDHPAARAAIVAEQEIGTHLHQEIGIATKGVQVDLRLATERVATLEKQRDEVQDRLMTLAAVRAQYSNLVAAAKHRSDILTTIQQELSEAEAGRAAARTTSLLTLIDQPDTGSRPAGPGRTTIVLAGLLGGLLVGAGLVMLSAQSTALARPTAPARPARDLAAQELDKINASLAASGPTAADVQAAAGFSLKQAMQEVASGGGDWN